MPDSTLAYFLTFTTYGTWLHGKSPESVDSEHNDYGSPFVAPDTAIEQIERNTMSQPAYTMDQPRRMVVLAAIQEVCRFRGWRLVACHIRTNHIHVVVSAVAKPEKVINDFKVIASRRLTEAGLDARNRKRWTRHGSTRYLWDLDAVRNAVDYSLNRQGDRMECYFGDLI